MTRRRSFQVVLGLTVAATAFRFATIDVQSLWGDEAATVVLLRRPFGGMLTELGASESAPPLYYVLAWLWTHAFGTGAAGVRSLSVFVSAFTIPVAFFAARGASERAGLWAAAIAAVNPLTFYYAQEARAYGLLILLAGLSFVTFQRVLEQPDRRSLAWWGTASVLALLTHYFAAFVIAGEALWLLRRHGVRPIAPALGPFLLVGVALVPLAMRQRSDGKSDWIEDTALASRLAQAPKQFLVGIDSQLEVLAAGLAGLLAGAAILLVVTRGSAREQRVALLAATVAAVALGIPMLLSLSGTIDLFNGRNVVASWVPVAALAAVGLGLEAAPRLGTALGLALCAVMVATLVGVVANPLYQRDDFRAIARGLPAPRSARLVILPANADVTLRLTLTDAKYVEGRDPRVRVSELAFANLETRRVGKPPLAPVLPDRVPAGFVPAGGSDESNIAVRRYVSRTPQTLDVRALGRLLGEDSTALLQPPGR